MALKKRSVLILTIGATAIIVATGYVSNYLSQPVCAQRVAGWLYFQPIGACPFYLLTDDQSDAAPTAFDSIGAKYSVIASGVQDATTWPRLSLKTHTSIPFLISIDYFWEREPQIGGGATRWYFGIGGKIIDLGETNEFAT